MVRRCSPAIASLVLGLVLSVSPSLAAAPPDKVVEQDRITTHLNRPPVMACSVNPSTVYEGAEAVVRVHANASSPDDEVLTYSWSANTGQIVVGGDDADAKWDLSGVAPGTYTVTVNAKDGRGLTSSCAAEVTVQAIPRPQL